MTYTILDLFCGAGGAAKGYHDAGFNVIGIDTENQPRYPYEFHQADAIGYLSAMIMHGFSGIDAIHASPPCQRYSVTRNFTGRGDTWPDLVGPTRDLLRHTGLPYVIENVPGAPLIDPVILCGSHFGLTAAMDGREVYLRRHRLFESSFPIPDPGVHDHTLPAVTVAGHDVPSHQRKFGHTVPLSVRYKLMGIDWMGRDNLGLAVPPAYTRYVGEHLIAHLRQNREAA